MGDKTKTQVSKLKPGRYVLIDDEPCRIANITVSSPGKHGSAKARITAVGIFDGKARSIVKPTSAEIDVPIIDKRTGQIISISPDTVQIMDMETYDQIFLTEDQVGEARNFLTDNLEVEVLFFEGRPIGINLPNFVDLKVIKSDPWVKGDSVSSNTKPVTLETGYVIRVPTFIEEGEKIRVDTRTGEYVTRIKE